MPVGVRANLSLALARGGYDVVHGFEPGLPSLSYLALRDARAFAVATFLSPERLGYPPGKAQRERLLGRIDALVATSEADRRGGRRALARRLPGVTPGVDLERFRPGRKRQLVVLEWRPGERPLTRAVVRALGALPGWELVFLRTKPLAGRPSLPRALARARARADAPRRRRAGAAAGRGVDLRPGARGPRPRLRLEAAASGRRDRLAARRWPSSRSWRRPPSRGWPRTTTYRERRGAAGPRARRAAELRRGRGRARRALPRRWRAAGAAPREGRAARRPRLDPRRPAPAHVVVARLPDPGRGAARPRRGGGARRDRRHRPQRLRRRAARRSSWRAAATSS